MFNKIFKFFLWKMVSSRQTSLTRWPHVYQLVSITLEIYKSFDKGYEVRGEYFPWLLESIWQIWHDSVIFELTQNEISGNLLKFLRDILSETIPRVVLNAQVRTNGPHGQMSLLEYLKN